MTKLDILSDPICPWCYIGYTQLNTALVELGQHPFEIEWHPFQLNPDMPAQGMDRRDYLAAKFGGPDQAVKVYAQIDEHAKSIGLELNLGGIQRTPSTLNAHRLIHWAKAEHVQTDVVMALFRAYFEEGRDIGDPETLLDIADSAGMDGAVVGRLLASDADADVIRDLDTRFREMGVSSVPTFIVGGQHAVPGAQPPELWRRVVDEISAQTAAE